MKRLRLAAALVSIAFACSGGSEPDPVAAPDASAVEVRLERSECYGRCPNYEVAIDGLGNVFYRGRSFVRHVGVRTSRVSPEVVQHLLAQFEAASFFDLQDRYRQSVTDLSTTWLTLRIGDRCKRVSNYWLAARRDDPWVKDLPDWSAHQTLHQIAESIDAMVDIEQWIGTDEERREMARVHGSGRPGRTEMDPPIRR